MTIRLLRKQSLAIIAGFGVLMSAAATLEPTFMSANAQSANQYGVSIVPEWNEKGELIRPKGFRSSWVFLGSPLTPNALNGGAAGFPEYHNVYVQPDAFHAYRATGEWPEGTMMLKELQLTDAGADAEEDGSRYFASGRGYFPGAVNGIDIAVKDSGRFADSNNWGYFNFGHQAPPYLASAPAAPKASCAQCHIDNEGANGTEDMVFINLYRGILTPLPN